MKRAPIQLSDHFNYARLMRFVLPSIVMMVFTSIYGVVDGYFISNYVGKTPFAAINLIMPALMILGGFGFMVGAGGSALVGKTLGEGDNARANRYFTMMVWLTLIGGAGLSALGIAFMRPVARMLGATEAMMEDCVRYGRIVLLFNGCFMLQNLFQTFLITAERPKLGLIATVAAGATNMTLDFVMVGMLNWGVTGAALATGLSQVMGAAIPLVFFLRPRQSLLRLVRTKLEFRPLIKAMGNGASELVSNISGSFVSMLYNFQLLKFGGENGVAAYGVLMYVSFVFVAVDIGYTIGTAPIISFHFGADNRGELRNLLRKSTMLMGCCGALMTTLSLVFSRLLARIYVGYDRELFEMTAHAFRVFSFSFLMAGQNIFASSFFTALNNGVVSAVISFLRTLVFQLVCVLILPLIWGLNGIWWAITVSDALTFMVSMGFILGLKGKYGYL